MLRLYCPKCRTVLSVAEVPADGLARCPACAQVVRVPPTSESAPAPPPPPAPPEPNPGPPPAPPPAASSDLLGSFEIVKEDQDKATYDVVPEALPPQPGPDPLLLGEEVIEAVEETPEEAAPGEERRPRRKSRLRPGVDFPEPEPPPKPPLLPGVSNFALLLIVLAALWGLLAGVALLTPSLAVLPIGVGGVLAVAGLVWFLTVAFHDDAATGILCLILPFYALYFLTRCPDQAGRPFMVALVGALILASGLAIHAGAG